MSFNVKPEELTAHATVLEGIKGDMERAKQTAKQVGYGGTEAYGLFLQFLVPPILELCLGNAADLIGDAAELAGAFHNGIKSNNECYIASEEAIKDMFDSANSDGMLR
ncbi:hypothetical protein Afil01_10900 [Actinorhabdospora filicis]|uniref:Excreted virulence factor EspC, type VII ESX diderm n=1 Tax=Actinorhabdospora filicis TaxID=1785913 RepID=A0A9W6W7U4_9ACTN|nr:hypothetical protein [Actinorhabdospora filicis]GLZ76283.1 hypothetical protein Afil01_10900 [Actinorhabdospora filicis]